MYIKSRKRKKSNSTTHGGPALDYLGNLPAPTSPANDPYWTLRVDKKESEEQEESGVVCSLGKLDIGHIPMDDFPPKARHKLFPGISQKPKYAPDYVWGYSEKKNKEV